MSVEHIALAGFVVVILAIAIDICRSHARRRRRHDNIIRSLEDDL